jgi:hypothetical protein
MAVGRFLERLSTAVTHRRWIRVIVAVSQRWKLTFCYCAGSNDHSASDHSAQFTMGRESPNFCILAISVVRFTPSFAAAPLEPPTIHP